MGLAICHYFPRDLVVRIALFFLLVSCVLQGILIGSHRTDRGAGTIVASGDSTVEGSELLHIGAHPALYAANRTVVCHWASNSDTISVGCARFVEAFHAVSGLFMCSFILSMLSLLFAVFCVVAVSKTSTFLLAGSLLVFILPTAIHTAAVGVFFDLCVRYAKYVARRDSVSDGDVKYKRRYLANVAIASEAVLGVGTLLLLIRFLLAIIFRRSVKRRDIVKRDIDRFMQRHLVNDDWERQKAVLQSHARSVQLEMVIREGDSEEGTGRNGRSGTLRDGANEGEEGGFTFRRSSAHSFVAFDTGKGTGVAHSLSDGPHQPGNEPL